MGLKQTKIQSIFTNTKKNTTESTIEYIEPTNITQLASLRVKSFFCSSTSTIEVYALNYTIKKQTHDCFSEAFPLSGESRATV